ncbi:hypothetical protein [Nocardioides currus]|uniref:Uncharacterized protein n=1 Tax=Nocardioides currus TaxID=2133958 RepID=A0A2R7YS13_9ACTN|nr:hypothetical protein [Nocardioides currus]PUA79151.1 hypothetical protein C7S10_20655 [Nocardioides currus]
MSQPSREPAPLAVRAQILATEHWGLLAVRSQTWNEVMGRISAQLTFASASLVFLALAVQGLGYSETFRILAISLGVVVLLTGTLTSFRVANASQEDYFFVLGMNRLRAAYVDIDPTLAPYFVTGMHDDPHAVQQTYTMGPVRDVNHVLASAAMFVIVVNTIVAGGLVAFVGWPLGPWPAAGLGVVAGVLHFGLWILQGKRTYETNTDPQWIRFPTPPADVS